MANEPKIVTPKTLAQEFFPKWPIDKGAKKVRVILRAANGGPIEGYWAWPEGSQGAINARANVKAAVSRNRGGTAPVLPMPKIEVDDEVTK